MMPLVKADVGVPADTRASRGPIRAAVVCALALSCSAAQAQVDRALVLRSPLTPSLFAQALAVRNLELVYGRENIAVSASMATAEASLYEPVVFANLKRSGTDRQRTTEETLSNIYAQQEAVLNENASSAEAGVRRRLPYGGEVSLSLRHNQRASNILAQNRPPVEQEVSAGLVLLIKQPLLRGRGVAVTETDKRVAELEFQVSQWQYLQQLHKVLTEGLSLFWQVDVAEQAARWREELLHATDRLAEDARVRIEAGKLAPRAGLELARVRLLREVDLGRAQQTRDELKLRLLSQLNLEASQLPFLFLEPQLTSEVSVLRSDEVALSRWAPYQVASLRKRQGNLRLAFADNQRRSAVDLVVSYGNTGLANTDRRAAWGIIKQGSYPEWYVGLNMELGALGNRRQEAQLQAQLKRVEQADIEMAAIQQTFLNDRKSRQLAVTQLVRESALSAQEVQARHALLEDERKRFEAGLGLLSALLQAEQDLIESRIRAADTVGRLENARLGLLLAEGNLLPFYGIDVTWPKNP